MKINEQITVNGHPAFKAELTVGIGSFDYSRFAVGKMPSPNDYSWLMGILEGQTVEATVFSGTNVCGYTNEDQLRAAFASMNEKYSFWIKEPQLEVVIARFGDGKLGFHMGGMYCNETPAQIEAAIAAFQNDAEQTQSLETPRG